MKKKMDYVTKAKLIYSGELLFFSLIFLTIGILEMTGVLHIKDIVITIFNWVTLFGGTWVIVDFFWVLFSKKRRAKNSILDKACLLPAGIYLITFDLIALIGRISKTDNYDYYRFGISSLLLYLGCVYIFQGIYHWFKPIPGLVEGILEAEAMEKEFGQAEEALNNHGVIAFPTETVMGLAVYYDDVEAYNKLNQIKRRPEDKPYTMMVKKVGEIAKYAVLDIRAQKIIKNFMPGAITLLLPAKEGLPEHVTHGGNVIGIRIPENKKAQELLEFLDKPILVPSANRSGEKPARTSEEVKEIFGEEVDFVVEGSAETDIPSTIVDLTGEEVKVVREGKITLEQIEAVLKH